MSRPRRAPLATRAAEQAHEQLAEIGSGLHASRMRRGLTQQQVADRIREFYEAGVDLILGGFLHYDDDLPAFGRTVIPLVRELPARRRTAEELVSV